MTILKLSISLSFSLLAFFQLTSSNPLGNISIEYIEFEKVHMKAAESDFEKPLAAGIGTKVCMKALNNTCFEITRDFYHVLYRPVNFLPSDSATIDTRFYLYTKLHPKESHRLDIKSPEDILDSSINPKHKTKFIVHGFFDSTLYGKWMKLMKDDLLLQGEYNVILVDWSRGNGAPYTQASANARVVGVEIALLIQALQRLVGISPMDCHIIGHSLGSHIAGYAGERLNKLGRITAVDPAKPYFENMPPSVRIDPTDADFVDVIHTDTWSFKFLALGMSQAVGHVDFYPNNGMNQPGCTYSSIYSIFMEGLLDAARQFVSCNHQRAVDYFMYSINFKRALPVGYHCKNYEDFLDGQCSDCGRDGKKCAVMGIQAEDYKKYKNDSESIKMYLVTSEKPPFWVYSYKITVKIAKPKEEFTDRPGDISLLIRGSKTNYDVKLSTRSKYLVHGATYSFMISKQEELGSIKGLSFVWTSRSWNFLAKHTLTLDYVLITPMNIIDKQISMKNTKKFCNDKMAPIPSTERRDLVFC